MRFLIDNPLSWRLAQSLRTAGHDAVHVRDLGLASASDEIIFRHACSEGRILVTQDVDFGFLLASARDKTTTVILFRMSDARATAQHARIVTTMQKFANELLPGTIFVLTDLATRIRRF